MSITKRLTRVRYFDLPRSTHLLTDGLLVAQGWTGIVSFVGLGLMLSGPRTPSSWLAMLGIVLVVASAAFGLFLYLLIFLCVGRRRHFRSTSANPAATDAEVRRSSMSTFKTWAFGKGQAIGIAVAATGVLVILLPGPLPPLDMEVARAGFAAFVVALLTYHVCTARRVALEGTRLSVRPLAPWGKPSTTDISNGKVCLDWKRRSIVVSGVDGMIDFPIDTTLYPLSLFEQLNDRTPAGLSIES